MSDSDATRISSYQDNSKATTDANIAAAQNRDKVSPSGQLTGNTSTAVTNNATGTLSNNPIVSGSTDIINSTVTSLSQSLVSGAVKQATGALLPLQQASTAFFTTLALVSTATVEIAMELARGNARLIVTQINQKQAVIAQLQTEITALNNAMALILNSTPFVSAYIQKLLAAYNDIVAANNQLKNVVAGLQSQNPSYNNTLFNQAMSLLNQAEALILPPASANISSIRSTVVATVSSSVTSAENSLAAAVAIASISAQIAKLMIQYATLTEEINGLIVLFLTALNSFISSYQRNSNVDQATINNISSGTAQLDTLLAQMKIYLLPTPAVKSGLFYPVTVTTQATTWGIKLATIIAWLNLNPGAGSAALNATSASVTRYKQAVALLQGYGNMTQGTARLKVASAQEDYLNTGTQVVHVLFDANTVLASAQNPRNLLAEIQQFSTLLQLARTLDANIINALTPFINTPNSLISGAASVISNLSSVANSLGFDRVAGLIAKGDVANLFTCTAATATYVGAALVGVRGITSTISSNPNATDQDMAKLAAIDADLSSQNAVKQVEATRSATDTTDTYVATQNANQVQINKDCESAIAVLDKYDSSEVDTSSGADVNSLTGSLNSVTGNAFGVA